MDVACLPAPPDEQVPAVVQEARQQGAIPVIELAQVQAAQRVDPIEGSDESRPRVANGVVASRSIPGCTGSGGRSPRFEPATDSIAFSPREGLDGLEAVRQV